MTFRTMLKLPSAFLPLAMSLAALGLVVGYVTLFGVVRHADEGTPARIFQLLMAAQLPIIAFFGVRWLPRSPAPGFSILAVQLGAALLPVLTVIILEM